MWLLTTITIATLSTIALLLTKGKYQLSFLSLMLWGAAIMILVDHILGYEGGPFLEITTDGFVPNGTLLGIYMLIPVFLLWMGAIAKNALLNQQQNPSYRCK